MIVYQNILQNSWMIVYQNILQTFLIYAGMAIYQNVEIILVMFPTKISGFFVVWLSTNKSGSLNCSFWVEWLSTNASGFVECLIRSIPTSRFTTVSKILDPIRLELVCSFPMSRFTIASRNVTCDSWFEENSRVRTTRRKGKITVSVNITIESCITVVMRRQREVRLLYCAKN